MKRLVTTVVLCGAVFGYSHAGFTLSETVPEDHKNTEPAAHLQVWELYKNCKLSGVLNNPKFPECAFSTPPTPPATDLMGTLVGGGVVIANHPLVGVSGTIIDAATIAQSIDGSNKDDADDERDDKDTSSTLNSQLSDDGADNEDPKCSNGIFSDGCEEGGRTLKCALISSPVPMTPPWESLFTMLCAMSILCAYRPHA